MESIECSESIAAFLSFIRDISAQRHMAEADEQLANDETQDILHRLELYDDSYNDTAKLAKLLRSVRRKRRIAKDNGEIAGLIDDWAKENTAVIKSLERLLGAVRKAEKHRSERYYGHRTDVIESASLTAGVQGG